MSLRKRVYCPDCGIEMQFPPVTSDYTLTRADLLSEEDLLSDTLAEFYSCPDCGKTAVPNEATLMQQALKASAWQQAVAMELF